MRFTGRRIGSALAAALLASTACAAEAPAPPFTLTWTNGACSNCRTAKRVSSVSAAHGGDIWAIGYLPPGENAGVGDATILHSIDGGRTWRERPDSYQHNSEPLVSFANAREGWAMIFDMSEAESRLIATSDGGAHWRRLSLRNSFLDLIQYLGRGVGFAYSSSPYDPKAYLLATNNGGRRWRRTLLPAGFTAEAMQFVDGNMGFLAGCLDHRTTILRTRDGGRSWSKHVLETPAPLGNDNCYAGVDALRISADDQISLLANKRSFVVGDTTGYASAWTSADKGATWTCIFQATFQQPKDGFVEFEGPYRLANALLILKLEPRPDGSSSASALYSRNGGGDWTAAALAAPVSNCTEAGPTLVCSGEGFGLARIAAAPAR